MSGISETNGKPGWRDLHEAEARVMSALKDHQSETEGRFTRAHDYHNDLNDNLIGEIGDIRDRVDRIEAVLDQLRGAKNLLLFAVGTNLIAVVAFAYTIFIH